MTYHNRVKSLIDFFLVRSLFWYNIFQICFFRKKQLQTLFLAQESFFQAENSCRKNFQDHRLLLHY